MQLQELADEVVRIVSRDATDDTRTALAVRKVTQQALAYESFRLSCIDVVLKSLERYGAEWTNPPLYECLDPPLRICLTSWSPKSHNQPHLHERWTVSAVFQNEIVIRLFEKMPAVDCVSISPRESIRARRGEVGYLTPPCVHMLENPTPRYSAVLHIFADGHAQGKFPGSPDGAAKPSHGRGFHRQRTLCLISEVLADLKGEDCVGRLRKVFTLGNLVAKLHAVKALSKHDLDATLQMSRVLEKQLQGRDREALSRVNARLCKGQERSGLEFGAST